MCDPENPRVENPETCGGLASDAKARGFSKLRENAHLETMKTASQTKSVFGVCFDENRHSSRVHARRWPLTLIGGKGVLIDEQIEGNSRFVVKLGLLAKSTASEETETNGEVGKNESVSHSVARDVVEILGLDFESYLVGGFRFNGAGAVMRADKKALTPREVGVIEKVIAGDFDVGAEASFSTATVTKLASFAGLRRAQSPRAPEFAGRFIGRELWRATLLARVGLFGPRPNEHLSFGAALSFGWRWPAAPLRWRPC